MYQGVPVGTLLFSYLFHLERTPSLRDPLSWLSVLAMLLTVTGALVILFSAYFETPRVSFDPSFSWHESQMEGRDNEEREGGMRDFSLFSFSREIKSDIFDTDSEGREGEGGVNWRFFSGFCILTTASVLYSLYLVLAKKFVFLIGPPSSSQSFHSAPLSFVTDQIQYFFPSSSSSSSSLSSSSLSPSTLSPSLSPNEFSENTTPTDSLSPTKRQEEEKSENEMSPKEEKKKGENISNSKEEEGSEEKKKRKGTDSSCVDDVPTHIPHVSSLVPIGVCGRWAVAPIALTGV